MAKLKPSVVKSFSTNLEVYSEACLKIRTKQAKMVPLVFNRPQQMVHEVLAAQYKRTGRNRAIVLKARQEGVSTYTAARFFRRVHLFPNQEALVLADEKDRAQSIYGMYDRFAHFLPPEVKPMIRYQSKKTEMIFDNPDDKMRATAPGLGSKISIETANDANAARGSTVQMVHASELAFWKGAEDVWVSLAQAVPDDGSEIIVESTANGVGTFFHNMWLLAEEGEGKTEGGNGFVAIFLPWWVHEDYVMPLSGEHKEHILDTLTDLEQSYLTDGIEFRGARHVLTLEQVAWRRSTIRDKLQGDERAFRQEYPATPEEAFLVSGNGFFDEDVVKAYEKAAVPYRLRANLIQVQGTVLMKKAEQGYLKVWDMPSEEGIYVIAADTASGRQVSAREATFTDPDRERGGRDFSSADVFDVRNRKFVAQVHGRMAPELFAQLLYYLGILYSSYARGGIRSPSLIAVEKNHSSGETVLRELQQKFRYPRLYYSRKINRRSGERMKEVLGWETTVETRMPMLDNLAAALRADSITVPNKDTIKEFYTFVRGEDGKPAAQEGAHDDRVISAAIALYVAEQTNLNPPKHYNESTLVKAGSSPTGMFSY